MAIHKYKVISPNDLKGKNGKLCLNIERDFFSEKSKSLFQKKKKIKKRKIWHFQAGLFCFLAFAMKGKKWMFGESGFFFIAASA